MVFRIADNDVYIVGLFHDLENYAITLVFILYSAFHINAPESRTPPVLRILSLSSSAFG